MTSENPGLMTSKNSGFITSENPGLMTSENPGLTPENPGFMTYTLNLYIYLKLTQNVFWRQTVKKLGKKI